MTWDYDGADAVIDVRPHDARLCMDRSINAASKYLSNRLATSSLCKTCVDRVWTLDSWKRATLGFGDVALMR